MIYDADAVAPANSGRREREGRGTVRQKSFPGDQERSISTIRYFVSSARLVCASGCIRKSREGSSTVARQRLRRERESLEGYPPGGGSKRETRIVFRPGKLVIDTAARTSAELSRPPPRYSPSTPSTYIYSLFLAVLLSRSTNDKNIFAGAPMLTTSATITAAPFPLTFVITAAYFGRFRFRFSYLA